MQRQSLVVVEHQDDLDSGDVVEVTIRAVLVPDIQEYDLTNPNAVQSLKGSVQDYVNVETE